jgi:ACDE family multidrug resistance protein
MKRALFSLASIPLIMTLGNSMLIPVLPEIRSELRISSFQTSLLITVFSVMAIVLIPPAGYLSDRIGRKKVIIPSLIIAGLGGAVCGGASLMMKEPYSVIMAGRVLQGIGAAGAAPIVMPLIGDLFKSEKEVSAGLGIIETSNTFGKVISPILGSVLAWAAWYAPFLSIPVFSLISLLLVIFFVKSPKSTAKPAPFRQFASDLFRLMKRKGRWLYTVFFVGGCGMFILFSFLFYLSDSLEDTYHLKGILKGCVLAIPLAVLCSASYLTGKKIGENKVLMKWLTAAGFALAAAAIAACGWFEPVAAIIAALSAAGLGIGVALPCLDAFITEGIEKEQRGTVSSFYSSMRFAGVAFGPPAASLLVSRSENGLFWTLAGVSAAACAATLLAIRPGRIPSSGT